MTDTIHTRIGSSGEWNGEEWGRRSGGGGGGGAKDSLSVEETNKIRASLGLAPLK